MSRENWARLPYYLGMHAGQRRSLIQREPSLIEWRIYEFARRVGRPFGS